MKDRVVQHPHRYQLVSVSGQVDTYDIVAKFGTVTEAGTPINKANLLSDETAELYGLSANEANVDIVLRRGFGLSSYAAFCANANTDSLDSAFGKNNESEVFGIGRQLAMYSWFKGTDKTSSPFTNLMKQNTFAECLSNMDAFSEILIDGYIVALINASPYAVALYDDVNIGKTIAYLAGLNPDDFADMTALIANSTAMNAVFASETAMTAVAASNTAMTAVAASGTAMTEVIVNDFALYVISKNPTALEILASSIENTTTVLWENDTKWQTIYDTLNGSALFTNSGLITDTGGTKDRSGNLITLVSTAFSGAYADRHMSITPTYEGCFAHGYAYNWSTGKHIMWGGHTGVFQATDAAICNIKHYMFTPIV